MIYITIYSKKYKSEERKLGCLDVSHMIVFREGSHVKIIYALIPVSFCQYHLADAGDAILPITNTNNLNY